MLAASRNVQKVTAERASNDLKEGEGRYVKQIFAMLKINDRNINRAITKLQDFISIFSDDELDKRALEILGSFLSTVTGVPSARDHRK